jgi:hypothetical protein
MALVAVLNAPLILARPTVSGGSSNTCGCCGGGGTSVGRVWGGARGCCETSLADGKDRPCMRVLISLVLTVSLYHLTCETITLS